MAKYTMTNDAAQKLVLYGMAQSLAGKNCTSPAAWQTAMERMLQLNAFAPGEVSTIQPQPEPEPVAAPVLSEEARLDQEFFNEAGVLFREWVAFMERKHDYSVSVEDQKYIANVLIPRNNWPYHQHSTYDKVRRAMIRLGRFPETLYTKDELMSRAIENTNLGTLTYEDRMRIASDLQQLTERQS